MKRFVLNISAVTVISILALVCVLVEPTPAQATKLPAPQWPHVKHSGWHGLKVSWETVEGADGYAVYRWSKKAKRYVRCAWTKKTSWCDVGLKADKKYRYKVAAYAKSKGKRLVGEKSWWVAAVTYSKGAKVVNPGKPKAVKLAAKMALGDWKTAKASVKASAYGKGTGSKGAKPYSREVRVATSDKSIVASSSDEYIAVAPGSCKVWVVADNGARSRAVKVKVSHNPTPGRYSDPKNVAFYDPEVTEFLNACGDDLYWAAEEVFAHLPKHWEWAAKGAFGNTPSIPEWMPPSLRLRLTTLFSWEGFDESVYLQEIVFRNGNLRLRYHSDIRDSVFGAGWWGYELVGPHAYKDAACVARGWRYESDTEVED